MKILLKTIQRPTVKPIIKPVEASENLAALLGLMEMRRWKQQTEEEMKGLIEELNQQLKFIAHVKKCGNCLIELQLDVERYMGRRGPWYLDLINDPSAMEEFYEENPLTQGIPRVHNYKIGSYWTGPSEDTVRFIKDRMIWAKKVIRRELEAATRYLEILGSWDHRLEEKPEYPLQSSLFYFFWGDMMGRPINGNVLIQQIATLNPFWRVEYGIETVVQMKEDTIRLCSRTKHKINIDISLSSLDLYDFKAYLLRRHGLEIAVIYDEKDFYCDQLDTVLKTIIRKADDVKTSDFKTLEEIEGTSQ